MGRYEGLKTCFVAIHRIKHSISHDDCRVLFGTFKASVLGIRGDFLRIANA